MSDVSQGPGWWRASDDKWYAPERHPDDVAPSAPPIAAAPAVAQADAGAETAVAGAAAVLTIERPYDPGPVWRPGSKRPTVSESASSPGLTSTPPSSPIPRLAWLCRERRPGIGSGAG
jgi:hypothetical protein